jgi:arylsulfatase
MPHIPTIAEAFRSGGYQTGAVGKLHVYPQRDRIGFEEALIAEEGRSHLGGADDYEMFLADRGFPGQQFLHGMSNNEYSWRTWHLAEDLHVTNWTTWSAARMIKRRDPTRPGFWHVSYTHPHPPIVPLASYFERYRAREIDPARVGEWSKNHDNWPPALASARNYWEQLSKHMLDDTKRAIYALCTHIDHQIRVVIGSLREEGLLDDTVILFCGDHGDMLGDHGLYAKRLMYDGSARVPMILLGAAGSDEVGVGEVDDRLVGLQDIMPTLLGLAGLPIPPSCEGISMIGKNKRQHLYCESLVGQKASRMVTNGKYKLIWYPAGNRFQFFDLESDPRECCDLIAEGGSRGAVEQLTQFLAKSLYGSDLSWVEGERLIGTAPQAIAAVPNRGLSGQRGLHFPPIPVTDPTKVVGAA